MRQIPVILIAALLAIPAAGATWYSYGTYEPDTKFDENGPMWKAANKTAGSKAIYFNVFQTEFPAGTSFNNGLLGSRYQIAGVQNHQAIFGPWLDCNGDDYVGLAESALLVYPSELLQVLGSQRCPVGSTQNDGDWVYEYIPIGYNYRENPQNVHQMQIEDKESLVWGDAGFPGFAAAGSCPISPLPHGSTSGTGYMLRFLDCFTSNRVKNTINDHDVTPGRVLAWDCPAGTEACAENPQRSDSLLNVIFPESLFGNPESGETGALQLDSEEDGGNEEAAFTTWDCGSRSAEVKDPLNTEETVGPVTVGTRRYIVRDPTFNGTNGLIFGNYGMDDENFTDSDGTYAWAAKPAPAVIEPRHSWADGLNQTFRGFRVGGADEERDTSVGGDCDTAREETTPSQGDGEDGENTYSGLHQTAFFRADAPFEAPTAASKKQSDEQWTYSNGVEQEGVEADLFGPNAPSGLVTAPPTDSQPGWSARTLWATTPQSVNRNTLQPNGPAYWSFYAKLNVTRFVAQGYALPPNAGKYGSEACGSETTGSHNGWNCNSAQWYTSPTFVPIVDGFEGYAARVGMPYQLRDVDCYDGSPARGSGVFVSLVQFSPGADEDRNPTTPNTLTCVDAADNL